MKAPLECTGCAFTWEVDVPEKPGVYEFPCPMLGCGRVKRIEMKAPDGAKAFKSQGQYAIRGVEKQEDGT